MANSDTRISPGIGLNNDYIILLSELLCCFLFIVAFIYVGMNFESAHSFFNFFKSNYQAGCILPIGSYFFIVSLLLSIFVILGCWLKIDWLKIIINYFRLSQRRIILIGLTAAICISIVPLFISWSTANPTYSAMDGLIPYSDAAGYYQGAEHLLDTGKFDSWTQRRPLNSVLFAERLLLTNFDFRNALILQAVFLGISAYLAAFAVGRTLGKSAGILVFFGIFSFIAPFVPTTLTETLGITLGSLGFALLWYGVSDKHEISFCGGILVLTLALSARAGTMLILPALILFSGYLFRKRRKYNIFLPILTAVCTSVGFLINIGINWFYGNGASFFLSNYSYGLYGIAAGERGWRAIYSDYPQQMASLGSESAQSVFIYHKAFEIIWSNPLIFFQTLFKLFIDNSFSFVYDIYINCLFPFISQGYLFSNIQLNIFPFFPLSPFKIPVRILLLILFIFILPFIMRFFVLYKNNDIKLFLIVCVFSFFLTLPFFYGDGGFRSVAATFPCIVMLFVITILGLAPKSYFQKERDQSKSFYVLQFTLPVTMSVLIIFSVLIGPFFLPTLANTVGEVPKYPINNEYCNANQTTLLMRIDQGMPYLLVHDENYEKTTFSPNLQNNDLKFFNWDGSPNYDPYFTSKQQSPYSFLLGYDRISHSGKYIHANSSLIKSDRQYLIICAEPYPSNSTYVKIVKTASIIQNAQK